MRCAVRAVVAAVVIAGMLACETSTPTNPDPLGRTGYIGMRITCGASGPASIQCSAFAYCTGLYPFCPGFRDGDVTAITSWSTMHRNIAVVVAPGRLDAVAPGDTMIQVSEAPFPPGSASFSTGATRTVSVFPDLAIFATGQIQGSVYETGTLPRTGAISGATVEILGGRLAGRTAIVGTPPPRPTGFFDFGCESPDRYCFHAVPAAAYRLRVQAPGFITQEKDVVTAGGSAYLDFVLVREQ